MIRFKNGSGHIIKIKQFIYKIKESFLLIKAESRKIFFNNKTRIKIFEVKIQIKLETKFKTENYRRIQFEFTGLQLVSKKDQQKQILIPVKNIFNDCLINRPLVLNNG